ncbi:hypothetical protein HY490_03570, partial [Candidatus Woesearchaeota archaeon]|nr:hypothetical protein [Candidatus Woesearchaeota archaeon]
MLTLQAMYNLSDEELEFQVNDRLTTCSFAVWKPPRGIVDKTMQRAVRGHKLNGGQHQRTLQRNCVQPLPTRH